MGYKQPIEGFFIAEKLINGEKVEEIQVQTPVISEQTVSKKRIEAVAGSFHTVGSLLLRVMERLENENTNNLKETYAQDK